MLAFKNGACLKEQYHSVGDWMRNLVKMVCGIELPIQPLEANACYWRIKDGHEVEYAIGNDFLMFTSYGLSYISGTPSLEYPN
ncbi:putative sarcosine oxidase [Gossypium australe]|uniref:Putative sarcosine oxidase n=1 Tax=Gossypium australe TaxID=47621 RepID=A0A5B6W7F4_9ROSI|nr:putative sarcosine oxidase [Gossypium australe]